MSETMRDTGIEPLGGMPWGAHMCLFYETKQDALDTVVPYFKAGLESRERCVWIVSDPLAEDDAKAELIRRIPDAAQRLDDRSIEILSGDEWYLKDGTSDAYRILAAWEEKTAAAVADGFDGLRASGNAFWMQTHEWHEFSHYEQELNDSVAGQPMIVLCTYWLENSRASDLIDVVRAHQFTVARRHGQWEMLETPELRQAKQEILELKNGLEKRVVERTRALAAANDRLKAEYAERERVEAALEQAQAELARSARLTSISVLAGSIAHEINQPLTGLVTNSEAALRWLTNDPPDLKHVKAGLTRIVRDANRAADVIKRIRALVAGKTDQVAIDINVTIGEVVTLMRGSLRQLRADIRLELSAGLPLVAGDKLQLQQAIMNLVMNGAEAMAEIEGERPITIRTSLSDGGGVRVAVEDRGIGLSPAAVEHMFDPFVTTKPEGMGLGLSIARTVIEAHGGALLASPGPSGGTIFQFVLPGDLP
jgi:signal transduction histidine kinase